MKKRFYMLLLGFLMISYIAPPVWASTSLQSPWGQSSLGQLYRIAAIVGQIISYNQENDSYVVFGRLSVDDGTGYQIFEKRKFYRVYPKWGGTDTELAKMIGQGVKIFGSFECAVGVGNEEKLFAEKVTPYDPNTDIQAGMEPAFGAGIGPKAWIGYGVPVLTSKVVQMEVTKSSDVINQIVELKDILAVPSNGIIDAKKYCRDLFNANASSDRQERIKQARNSWQKTWSPRWFLDKDLKTNSEMQRAVQGTAFIYGQSGGTNGYIDKVPVIRPDVDKFMEAIEKDFRVGFEEWAAPSVFYGLVSKIPDELVDDNKKPKDFTKMNFTGVYYSDNNPKAMVDAIAAAGQGHSVKTKETWRIERVPVKRITELDNKQCWISGQRVLVYLHTYTDSKGKNHSELVEVNDGRIDDPDYSLVDYYIIPNKIITKTDYNFMVSLIREIAMQGGM